MIKVLRLLVCLIVLSFHLGPGTAHSKNDERYKRMEEISREIAKERNRDILFFGEVVDFEGAPIADADVYLRIRTFGARPPQSDFKEFAVKTDEQGKFTAAGFGELISLVDVVKEGYAYDFKYNRQRSQWSRKIDSNNLLGFEPENPMVFRLRKKAHPAFVISDVFDFAQRAGKSKMLDLYLQNWTTPDRLFTHKMSYPDWHADIRVSLEGDGENFRLVLEALDADSGFALAKPEFIEEMAEAPEHGYRPKVTVPVARNDGGHLFAYVKSAGGLFYSKLRLSYYNRDEQDYVVLRWGYWTNMTGQRALEYSPELYHQYLDEKRAGLRGRLKREQLLKGEIVIPTIEAKQ